MLKSADQCMSPHSNTFTVMDTNEYEELYNVVAHQRYPQGITKNKKDALRNKSKKFVVRDGLLYYCDQNRGERQVRL